MKKWLKFIPIPLLVLALIVYIYLESKKPSAVLVGCENWIAGKNPFYLCEMYVSSISTDSHKTYFTPTSEFFPEKIAEESNAYIDTRVVPYVGIQNNISYLFYEDDCIYALSVWNSSYLLRPCLSEYLITEENSAWYSYPAPGDWVPEEMLDAAKINSYCGSFASVFGTYEEAVDNFYKYFSEDVVKLDEVSRRITVRVTDKDSRQLSEDRAVVIDFETQSVHHVTGEF